MRSRNRTNASTLSTYTHCQNGAPYDQAAQLIHSDYEEMNDVVTPGFHAKIKAGEIINNSCEYVRYKSSAGGGSYYATNGSVTYDNCGAGSVTMYCLSDLGSQTVGYPALPNVSGSAEASAKLAAIADIDSTPYAFMEDVFEARETLAFLRKPLTGLRAASKSWVNEVYPGKAPKFNILKRQIKFESDAWLEYRFAVTPLVRSSMDALMAYHGPKKRQYERMTSRGYGKHADSSDDTEQNAFYTFLTKVREGAEVRAGIMYELKNPCSSTMFQLGLRPKDIPETLWAVMPYSFMVDRVVNISNVVRGATNLMDSDVKIVAGWYTTKSFAYKSYQAIEQWKTFGYSVSVTGDVYAREKFSYKRTPWSPGFVDLRPPIELSGLVKDLTSTADLAALIAGRFKLTALWNRK